MEVQTLANVYQTTRGQVAGETANCHRQMLASLTLRCSAFDSYTVRLFTVSVSSARRTDWF
jgi:hypothetical protein